MAAKTKLKGAQKFEWAYKVVNDCGEISATNFKKIYRSAWIYGKWAATYQLGEETRAKVGGLLVFKTEREAKVWAKGLGLYRILKLKAYGKVPLFKAANCECFNLPRNKMQCFWNPKTKSETVSECGCGWPKGTLAFRKIIPTKVVK